MAFLQRRERVIELTDDGTDRRLITVPAGCLVIVHAVRVTTAQVGGTMTYAITDTDGTDANPGTNTLMSNGDIAATTAGLKRNTATNQAPGGWLYTATGSVWLDITQTGAPTTRPAFRIYLSVTRIEPGAGEV